MRTQRGQALVELALVLPLLLMLLSLGVDVGRAYGVATTVKGAARAGVLTAIQSPIEDVGASVRQASSDLAAGPWGDVAFDHCADSPRPGGTHCGDPEGCDSSSGYWSAGARACYAVGWCRTHPLPDRCTGVHWDYPPIPTNALGDTAPGYAIVVRVATRLTPLVDLSGHILGARVLIQGDAYFAPQY